MDHDRSDRLRDRILDMGIVVAIDGPSGSGKSSVARQVAGLLDTHYLDTGAMYRAVTWKVLERGIDPTDQNAVIQAVWQMDLEIITLNHAPAIFVDEVDITRLIRTEEVTENVSKISVNLGVRQELIDMQRDIISESHDTGRGIVVEGRDITTAVAPEAEVRILLTASPEARLQRRAKDMSQSADAANIRKQVLDRDNTDSTVAEFDKPAPGVILLDTSELSLKESVVAVVDIVADYVGI